MIFRKTLQKVQKILWCIKHSPFILFILLAYYSIISFLELNAQLYILLLIPHFHVLATETLKQLIPNAFHGLVWPPVNPINSALAY